MPYTGRAGFVFAARPLIACGLVVGCASKKPDPVDGGSEDAEVRAEVVAEDVRDDPLGTDAKYRGKTIIVEGPVKELFQNPTRGAGGVVVVVPLAGTSSPADPEGRSVYCECRSEDGAKAAELSLGQTVKIRGRCGENALAPGNCTIESVGPDPAIGVMASELVTEFLKNEKAATAKYKGKQLTLDAVVKRKDGENLELATDPKTPGVITVTARRSSFDPVDRARFAAVKPGDRVTIKCQFFAAIIWGISFEKCRLVP